jgi:predicted SAM-dependent methyltransferase
MKPRHQSETAKHRARLAPFCEGFGVDIGFGGDPIIPTAIRMDLESPYAAAGDQGVQLGGDCRNLIWFKDDILDFAYSSHVLEDFDIIQTEHIMREWTRVLKVGGKLVLLQPDQQRYLAYCRENNHPPNPHHSIDHFSLAYVTEIAARLGNLEAVASANDLDEYSFFVVFKKTKSASRVDAGDEIDFLRRELARVNSLLETSEARLQRYRKNPIISLARKMKGLGH